MALPGGQREGLRNFKEGLRECLSSLGVGAPQVGGAEAPAWPLLLAIYTAAHGGLSLLPGLLFSLMFKIHSVEVVESQLGRNKQDVVGPVPWGPEADFRHGWI